MKKQEDVICNQEEKNSVETDMLMTDGRIIHKPKKGTDAQRFKGDHSHNEGKNRESPYRSRDYKRASS